MDFDSPDFPEQNKQIIQIMYHSKTEDVHPVDKQKWLKSLGLSGEGITIPKESVSSSKSSSYKNLFYEGSNSSLSSTNSLNGSIFNNLTNLAKNNINKFTISSNTEVNLANDEEINRGLNWDEAKRIVEQRLDLSLNNNI